jgi:glucosamine--fructose-6-phosphate aminotransferase (isomerizing)
MCGIVGYIGPKPCVPVIMEGLARLEYRGYDSAGIAVAGGGHPLQLRRAPGKLRNLAEILAKDPVQGTYGIGHTRWATHGRPTEENAHPHRDGTGTLVVVHNGIVENYLQLKAALTAKGHKFTSETDTEIIAHVIQDELELAGAAGHPSSSEGSTSPAAPQNPVILSGAHSAQSKDPDTPGTTKTADTFQPQTLEANESQAVLNVPASSSLPLEEAVRRAVARLTGAFAIGVLSAAEPDKLVAARMGPPAVLGIGDGEFFLASDVPGILHHTRLIHFLQDGEVATLTTSGIKLMDFQANVLQLNPQRITWDPIQAEKAGYKHFMLKEINEQPRAVRDTTLGRVSLDTGKVFLPDMKITPAEFKAATGITIAACGTSWHAGLAGKFMIERLARLPVDVDYASEYRYRDPIPNPLELGLLITQSGETADTIAAQHELIAKGSKTLAICNVVGSAVTRLAAGVITTNAGPEIGVASTKAFTAQLTALFTLALYLAQVRGTVTFEHSLYLVGELAKIPQKLEEVLRTVDDQCHELAKSFSTCSDFLFLGRGIHYPIALEGALKLKEISYIHAEGYPAGEMKHGPNALIDETLPVVCIATQDPNDPSSVLKYEKTLSNIQEVTARSGRVIAIAIEGDTHISQLVEHVIHIPQTHELLLPILEVVPLQLLAYHIAVRRGCDVDQPRNLAKSVTVE